MDLASTVAIDTMPDIMKILLIIALFPLATLLGGEPVSISALGKGEKAEILFTSQGCFHGYTNLVEIADGMVSFSDIEMRWDAEKKQSVEVSRKAAGVSKLEKTDALKLDQLLKYYESGPPSGCTTVDTIVVRILREGKEVRSETYKDGSCGTYEMKEVLTIPALKERLTKAG